MNDVEKYFNKNIISAGIDVSYPIIGQADKWKEEGIPVIRMDMGTPDLDCPQCAKDAAVKALREGESHYTDLRGIPKLRRAIADKERRDNGLELNPDENIIVTVGASEALLTVCATFLSPGDEILIPSPGYCAYFFVLTSLGIKVSQVPIVKDCVVDVRLEDFRERITPKTKMILLNSPHNPTGLVYSREQLESIAQAAKEYDLLVLSDECYDKYLFEGQFFSIAALPGMWERTIIVNSVSKAYAMTGWRVGFIAARKEFCYRMEMFHGNLILCAPSFAQFGAAEAFLQETEEQMTEMREIYKKRRGCIMKALDEIDEVDYVKPKGAFYVFVNVEKLGLDGYQFAAEFLNRYKVTCCPGEIYGKGYENYIRFAYTCSYEEITEGMTRLKHYIKEILQRKGELS